MAIHDFASSLRLSASYAEAPWWEEVYRSFFPNYAGMVSVREDGWAQRGGVDRVVTLRSGKTVTVDEKVRLGEWQDILLERWSDRDRRIPGWVQKDLACDFIAYAFVQSQRCYLLPFPILRRAWQAHGREWIDRAEARESGFEVVPAANRGYVTESIAVPVDVLFDAITGALVTTWSMAA